MASRAQADPAAAGRCMRSPGTGAAVAAVDLAEGWMDSQAVPLVAAAAVGPKTKNGPIE